MSEHVLHGECGQSPGTFLPVAEPSRIPVVALGTSLGLFFALTYVLCVGFDLLFPAHAMYTVWAPLLPGFNWISWPSFFLGLVEAVAYGWYIALVFAPMYNFLCRRNAHASGRSST